MHHAKDRVTEAVTFGLVKPVEIGSFVMLLAKGVTRRPRRPSCLDPQWTVPGGQRFEEDSQTQRQEFPIRIHREDRNLR